MSSSPRKRSSKPSKDSEQQGDVPLNDLDNPLLLQQADAPIPKGSGRANSSASVKFRTNPEPGQKKKQEKSGSLIGQIGSALIGEAKGDDGEEPERGAPTGADSSVDTVLGTIACSAVQGMRRAVAAKSIPVKVFWTLMVLLSIGLFLKAMLTISLRLVNWRTEKSYQLDKVPFVFPDLYFCPNNAYSGSFPYMLDEARADAINREVERLGQLFDQQFPTSGRDNSSRTRSWMIQQSLSVPLLKEYIMHRPEQSMFFKPMITSLGYPGYKLLVLPGTAGNRMCFKILLTDAEREALTLRLRGEDLRLALFTDPYFSDFNYTGYPIKPIVNTITHESIPFRVWYPSGVINMMGSGYTMFIVPVGVYPAMEYEARFKLAPGKSYDIDIQMEENRFSDELLGSQCSSDHENAAFVNQLTNERMEFNYSYAGCFFTESARNLHSLSGYVQEGIPITWDLKGSPRWGNLSDMPIINRSMAEYELDLARANEQSDPSKVCRLLQPCVRNRYSASFSFHNWPNTGGSYSNAFNDSNHRERPAISHMVRIARELDAGNQPSVSHAEFRHIISDSLLEVRIRAKSPLATQVLMTSSYTSTSYLSDLGGLMGLYLGCSVLTLFELLEILYLKGAESVREKYRKRKQKQSGGSATDNCEAASEEDQTEEPQGGTDEEDVEAGDVGKKSPAKA